MSRSTEGYLEVTSYISPDGVEYDLNLFGRALLTEEGLGAPPMEFVTQKGPYQHGETLLDYRLGARTFQLVVRQNTSSREKYWAARSELMNILRLSAVGNLQKGIFRKKFRDGSIRDLDVVIQQGPGFVARDLGKWDEYGYTETLRFVAHDPIFYNPTRKSLLFSNLIPAPATTFSLPATLPITFGSSLTHIGGAIDYPGTWISYPTIVIFGPMSGFILTNTTTGEVIQFTYVLSIGETVTVDLAPGNKTAVSSDGTVLTGSISKESDLVTFHLDPSPDTTPKTNDFTLQTAGIDSNSYMELQYYERFWGI